jgi:hypothetical protein
MLPEFALQADDPGEHGGHHDPDKYFPDAHGPIVGTRARPGKRRDIYRLDMPFAQISLTL